MIFHIHAHDLTDPPKGKPQGSNAWQRLTVPTRLICIFLLVFAIALTPNGRWWTWSIYGVVSFVILSCSHIDWKLLIQRMAIESAFIGVILLGTLFRGGGEVLWQWGWLKVTSQSLVILLSIGIKAFLSLLLLNILTLSISIPLLLQALVTLRIPPLLVSILASMYRYINVLTHEFSAMHRAAIARNLNNPLSHPISNWQRQILGNMLGMLFIRTYERGDRIYQAMLARGYQGISMVDSADQSQGRDRLAIAITVLVILLAQIL